MSRYNAHFDITKILELADRWREQCLLGDGSLFTDERLWTEENCKGLQKYYIGRMLGAMEAEEDNKFMRKLRIQFSGEACKDTEVNNHRQTERAPASLYKLMAEVICLVYLADCSRNNQNNRINYPRTVWEWSGEEPPANMSSEELQKGIGSAGRGLVQQGSHRATKYLIEFILFWKTEGGYRQNHTLLRQAESENNAWQFAKMLHDWNGYDKTMRNTLVYLLFPDYFERIFAQEKKRKYAVERAGFSGGQSAPIYEIDKALYAFRKAEEQKRGTHELDHFDSPWKDLKGPQTDSDTGGNGTMQPLNQILYGPPGTGKTHNTAEMAVRIIDGEDAPAGDDEIKARYQELLSEGQIVFITFHQSYGYEEFIEGIRPDLDSADGEMSYEIRDGLFKELCARAVAPSTDNFDEAYDKLLDEIDGREDGIPLKTARGLDYNVVRGDRFDCIGFAAKRFRHEKYNLTRRTLRKSYETGVPASGLESYTPGLLNFMKQECGLEDRRDDNSSKPYVLIIDEINRGNISKIFGELITLIEENKRKGGSDELSAKLPYSGEKFSVPANVHIIGTMNTADRSIALLDTALRRRFRFIEMMPKSNLLREVAGVNLPALLDKMNERITKLHNRNHCIGHSYLMEADGMDALAEAFEHSIIPLLREYFFDDMKSIAKALNDAFCERQELLEGKALSEALKQPEQYRKIYGDDNG